MIMRVCHLCVQSAIAVMCENLKSIMTMFIFYTFEQVKSYSIITK